MITSLPNFITEIEKNLKKSLKKYSSLRLAERIARNKSLGRHIAKCARESYK